MINIKSIWQNQMPTGEVIIRTRIEDINHLNCYAGTNNITGQNLFILSFSESVVIPDLKNYRFQGVEIITVNEGENIDLYVHLLDNDLSDIFALFIQNILEEIELSMTENQALIGMLNVVAKWKKLFDKLNFVGLSEDQQKGLIGELLFLNVLISNERTARDAVNSWTGAERDFQSKDFTFGSLGIELKFTTSKQPKIIISNERQLDAENLRKLFLVLYSAEAVKENGISLNSVIEHTRKSILTDEERNVFNAKLNLYGYFDDDRNQYGKMYSIKKEYAFTITSEFPKIVKNELPIGLFDVSYSIEISAGEKFIIELQEILSNI
jgi:hypothetical protein